MRQGADQVKLMVSGGVASPYDPLESLQFTEEEISAAVEEAHAFGRYVLTHAYTPEAITRAVNCGVRTIEHGNLVDAPTARLMAKKSVDVIRSATLVGAEVVRQEGKLGTIAPGAFADLLVVDGNPLKNLGLFKDGGPHLSAIVKAGKFHKNVL